MYGTAGRVMRVEKVPLMKGARAPGPPSLSLALPAIPVQHPGLELPRPPPCTGASRGATAASQVSSWGYRRKQAAGKSSSSRASQGEERGLRDQAQRLTPPSSPQPVPHSCVPSVSILTLTCLQILAQCPGLPLISLGCLLEGGRKMGNRHQGTLSPCPKRARRMSYPLRCTR